LNKVPAIRRFRLRLGKFRVERARVDGYSLIELIMVTLILTIAFPGIIEMYTTVLNKSHDAEVISIAELLAVEQMEIIKADKAAGSAAGLGYAYISQANYSGVNPSAPFNAWSRTVTVQTYNAGGTFEYKLVTVSVNHDMISAVVLKTILINHEGLG